MSINVQRQTPTIAWPKPRDIICGTALGERQLNATATVPGKFVYEPPSGTVLPSGTGQCLSVTFTPRDANDYRAANKIVLINVQPTPAQPRPSPAQSVEPPVVVPLPRLKPGDDAVPAAMPIPVIPMDCKTIEFPGGREIEILPTLKFSIKNESQHWMFRCGDIEIANIFVDKGNLAFRWADNGSRTRADLLRNCPLQVTTKNGKKVFLLREPDQTPLSFTFKKKDDKPVRALPLQLSVDGIGELKGNVCCKWEDAGEHWKITGRNKGKEGKLQPLYDLVYSLADDHGRHVVSFTAHVGDEDRDLRQGKLPVSVTYGDDRERQRRRSKRETDEQVFHREIPGKIEAIKGRLRSLGTKPATDAVKQQINDLNGEIAELNTLKCAYEDLENAKLHLHIYMVVAGQAVDLVKTTSKPPTKPGAKR